MLNTAPLLTGTYLNKLITQTPYTYRIRFRKQLYKAEGPFARGCPTYLCYEVTGFSKAYNHLSWLLFPNHTLALWDGKVCAVLHCPVQSPQTLLPLSVPVIWNSQIEYWATKNLKKLPAAYLPLSFSARFCALSGTTSFSVECFPFAVAGQKIYTSYKLS